MSIETKLREGSQAIRQATREAEFTSTSPADRRGPLNGPLLARVGGLAVIALLAVPALLAGVGGQPGGGVEVGADPSTSTPSAEQPAASTAAPQPAEFPHLLLDLPDTELVDAYENYDEAGERIGTHSVYRQIWTISDGERAGEQGGREILLRVQEEGAAFDRFDYYAPLAEGKEIAEVNGRSVLVHLIPDEAIEEGSYDLGILQWTEADGYEVVLIPWGLDKDGALALMDGLTTIGESDWDELRGSFNEPATTTTIIESGTPTTGAVDAPGNPAPDGP